MTELPAFPLSMAHLPGDVVSLRVFEDRYRTMLDHLELFAEEGAPRRFATMLIERGSEVGGGDVRCEWGVTVEVQHVDPGPGWSHLVGRASSALVVRDWLPDDPYPRALVELQTEDPLVSADRFDAASAMSLVAGVVVQLFRSVDRQGIEATMGRLTGLAEGRWWGDDVTDEELWRAFWTIARSVPCGAMDRYSFLGPGTLPKRIRRVRDVVEHVSEVIAFRSADQGNAD